VTELLSRFRYLVTFNGKAFDVPLLEARFRLNRSRFPLHRAPHLDLLHPARRLWKARLESCRLQSLEVALLHLHRHEDVDGWEIPQVYFDWVRRRDPRGMARVLEHNRLDILSLAALTAHACHVVQGTQDADDPRDLYCLARVLERAGQPERALARYRLAVEGGSGPVRVAALLRLGSLHRRAGEHAAARAAWEEAAAAGDWVAHQRLAIHHERRSHDLGAALAAVERGLALLEADDPQSRRARRELLARRERILARQARRAERAGRLTPTS
jgi:tetratricopeptide (TPR) repeat protein